MARRLSMALPALFVLVFAFGLVVSMQSPGVAAPSDCCRVVVHCNGYTNVGECPRIDGVCRCDMVVSYCDPAPAGCLDP